MKNKIFRLTPEETLEFIDARITHFREIVIVEQSQKDPTSLFPRMETTRELQSLAKIEMLQLVRLALFNEELIFDE